MTREDLIDRLNEIQNSKSESRTLELKAAKVECPKRLYDTLSSFSNQADGGIIIFGVDQDAGFEECGVYDAQDLQVKIKEQCKQMEPEVRPVITIAEKDGKAFVAAEIQGIDVSERPCFYRGKGRLKGSYVRIGESDEPMTEYEVYSYEAYRKRYQDDIRIIPRATLGSLDSQKLDSYIKLLKQNKLNLSNQSDDEIYDLMSVTRDNGVTLSAVMLFGKYPQSFFPQLSIIAVVVPGTEYGDIGTQGERFMDNIRIEGTIDEMLEQAMNFVNKNMKVKTVINPDTGKREDSTEYPVIAIREAIINALVHRDYSIHTEGKPIQIIMYSDRIEIRNPGGIYGRMSVNQLGRIQPDTRNPVLVNALEVMNVTENRYSGIPAIRRSMKESGLQDPEFSDEREEFRVVLYNGYLEHIDRRYTGLSYDEERLILFLDSPRTRDEIAGFFGLNTVGYAVKKYVEPLIDKGLVRMTIPNNPRSRSQRYVAVRRNEES